MLYRAAGEILSTQGVLRQRTTTDATNPTNDHESNTTEVDPELKLPKLSSLVIVISANLLLQISFFIIVSSSNEYAIHLGGNSTFSGVVIGIPTVFSGLALLPLTKLDKGGYKIPLHLSCGASILGHILYSSAYRADFLYLILIGRIVSGFAFSFWMYCKRYCSDPRIVGVRRRTTLASWLVIGQGLGMSLGPFAGGLLYKIGFDNPVFNGFTSPGWIMAAIWSVFWVCVIIWYEDIPKDQRAFEPLSISPASQSLSSEKDSTAGVSPPPPPPAPAKYRMTYAQWGVVVCMCWFAMTCFFILGAWESNLPVFGADTPKFHWSPFAAGNFIALGGITTFPFLILNLFLAKRTQDRKILAMGSGLGLSALLVFLSLLRSGKLNYGSVFMCWWAVALGFNLASTVTMALLSKQLPPSWNGRTSLAIQYSNYTGRVTGAIWGGSGIRVGMMNYVGLEIALVGIGATLFIVFWRDLKTKKG
ncbi:major facilitator superfamily domain-containing protein [Collybia nuda]|uniref:Major facilitator superfamily domain-containing protein n=1 Tax=Collybia nuda TaxID=64659 RepID=A0A9P5YFR0_9AGAR|nr:major facilitator superfamily domain-containing protein [Collybia nuda]